MARMFVGALVVYGAICSARPAAADVGPCKPESNSDPTTALICGIGKDAARVVANTFSPSHRLALAWRMYDEPARTQPQVDTGLYQSLIIRLHDGVILGSSGAVYRDPGNTHGNNLFVVTAWSPNSRFMVATFDGHRPSDGIDVYTFRQRDDALTGPINLQPIIGSAIQGQMKDVQDAGACDFSVSTEQPITIDNRGIVQGTMIVTGCAAGLHGSYDVRVQVKHDNTSPEPSRLGAKLLSIAPSKAN